jgi:hypothetical protein
MVLILFRVQNVAKRLDLRRINAMRFVHKIKPDSSGLDPATQPASVRGRIKSSHPEPNYVRESLQRVIRRAARLR